MEQNVHIPIKINYSKHMNIQSNVKQIKVTETYSIIKFVTNALFDLKYKRIFFSYSLNN